MWGNQRTVSILEKLKSSFFLEYEQYILMVPILLACGIGFYFSGNNGFSLADASIFAVILLIFYCLWVCDCWVQDLFRCNGYVR